ncbi:MAG: aquaporin Z [Candidatus Eremiobacteraeota bacterium]|nr:aquaporin Z [Candidatus Eremiobacteraeota bacterium]MBV9973130.1 aquaporin Z [Candidatus Eremiobacteraeota bacterium]
MNIVRRASAELFGTFWLVLGGCGSAVLAAAFPQHGIGFAGVALAFGLTLLTMAYTIGPISGCHINPAVTFGLWLAKRFPARDVLPYMVAQVVGAIIAAAVLYLIANGKPGFVAGQFASNGYGPLSPGGYGLGAAALVEIVLTFGFLMVILGATDRRAPVGFAGLAIGLALTLIHLIAIPVDNTSVNPARSTGPAIFAGTVELSQLWLFWIAPMIGGGLAGLLYPALFGEEVSEEPIVGKATVT